MRARALAALAALDAAATDEVQGSTLELRDDSGALQITYAKQ